MSKLKELLENNKLWADQIKSEDPHFFQKLAKHQEPDYLWIGCSDSRMPATQLVGLDPGEMFVHRNVANVVGHTDLNCLSVIQYAVDALKVEDIIVCGHYGCGGVKAAMLNWKYGLIDNWLRHIQDVMEKFEASISRMSSEEERLNRLCELNVIEQTVNVCQTTVVQTAWDRGDEVAVHGLIYDLHDGLLRDLNICITNQEEIVPMWKSAVASLSA